MDKHTLFQQYFDSDNFDVSDGNGFINIHTLSQCYDSSIFKEMDGDIENGGVNSGYGYMNIHTVYQLNGLESLMKYNYRDDMDMNDNLQNVYASIGIGLTKATLPPNIMNQVTLMR